MNTLLAGLTAAFPIALVTGLLLWIRSVSFVPQLKATNTELAGWNERFLAASFSGGAAVASLAFGVLAGWVYGRFLARFPEMAGVYFPALAFAIALLASLLAWRSRTPMQLEKVLLNFLFALGFGILIPALVG